MHAESEPVIEELRYGRVGDLDLQATLYKPANGSPQVAVVDVHGGAWYRGDRHQGAHYDRALAARGALVLAIEFRHAIEYQHPAACQDITAAVRYLKTHASALRIDNLALGLIGSSSGGHLALLSALQPDVPAHLGTRINTAPAGEPALFDDCNASAAVDFAIALWPVSDPLYRYHYAQRTERPELITGHEAYFETPEVMADASVPRLLDAGEQTHLPPLLIVQPGADRNVPIEMTRHLVAACESQQGYVQYAYYPGMPHGFACRAGGYTQRCIDDMWHFMRGTTATASAH